MKPFLRLLCLILSVFTALTLISCGKEVQIVETDFAHETKVITLDVENGNATLITTPGANILIDCGASGKVGENTIEKIKAYGVKEIDYFILSHIDDNHIGATELIFENFSVKKVFVPNLNGEDVSRFNGYADIYNLIKSKVNDSDIYFNQVFTNIELKDGLLLMLSPSSPQALGGSYDKLLASDILTESLHDDVSPIIYFSYKGVRFVFSSDAGINEEKLVLDNNSANLYNAYFNKQGFINLSEVDFYSLSSHGDDTGNSPEFIDVLKPKNALVSVSTENKNCPKTSVLDSLYTARLNTKIFSTMLVGDICAYVNANGEYIVKTQKDTYKEKR